MVDVNGTLFFCAYDLEAGEELWKSNGSPAGTVRVKDILPGRGSSFPQGFASMGGNLYFVADDGVHGFQLWKSNGTDEGTVMVKDFGGDTSALAPRQLTGVGNTLFFYLPAEGPTDKVRLWKSDGTESGTVPVDHLPNLGDQLSSVPLTDFMEFRGELVFVSPGRIWKSDGTSAGTVPLTSTGAYGFYGGPRLIATASKLFYFITRNQGYALLATDGSGEAEFLKILPFPSTIIGPAPFIGATGNGNTLYFTGVDEASGNELWKSDGTADGTVLVKDLRPGNQAGYALSSNPTNFLTVNGVTYFSASDGGVGENLWRTDGTTSGTTLVRTLASRLDQSPWSIRNLYAAGGRLYFIRFAAGQTSQLWSSDGTSAGTRQIKQILLDGQTEATASSSGLLFVVSKGGLWRTDGTRGTLQLTQLMAGTKGSLPTTAQTPMAGRFVTAGDQAFFAADDGSHGCEWWSSTGSPAETKLLKDFVPGSASSTILDTFAVEGRVFSVISDKKGSNLWVSDGTTRGTLSLLDLTARSGWKGFTPRILGRIGREIVFIKRGLEFNGEIWKSDGTKRGTVRVRAPGNLPSAQNAPPATADTLFFMPDAIPNFLCRTDGTAGGTWLIDYINARDSNELRSPDLCRLGGMTYFRGGTPGEGGLMRTDGTSAGTSVVKAFTQSDGGYVMSNPIILGNRILMMFHDRLRGSGLWSSDGTPEGTSIVSAGLAGNPFSEDMIEPGFVRAGGSVYFLARQEDRRIELWKSDGTAVGTVLVRGPVPENQFPQVESGNTLVTVGATLYFSGWTPMEGRELWRSDGTPSGTTLVKDLTADSGSADPSGLTRLGNRLLFFATDGATGQEPWTLDVSADLPVSP
jgi:ELWxxDGT repeat protein